MGKFLDQDFLLQSDAAKEMYHDFAGQMPIIDYHCHLPVQQIADDINFENLTHIWLYGDHYKWRAMRTNGVGEAYVTGDKTDFEKFEKWAETVPYTLRNPLYHWTHLELQRYFDVHGFEIKVLPAFRPDKAMNVDDVDEFNLYLKKLETASGINITTYQSYLDSLKQRHDFFATMGCSISDHGLENIDTEDYTDDLVIAVFNKIRRGRQLSVGERAIFKSAMLHVFAIWDHEKGWVQQYHLGALRNNNARLLELCGPDSGWDSIGDFHQGKSLAKFLQSLDSTNQLAKTILYNLNPSCNELMATMCGNFNDGSIPGKIQFGTAWWFLDQKDGMTKQMSALSNMGLISRFIGMTTDSRSFLSYPRHEYFRRVLCNLFGEEIENGELPGDKEWAGKIIKDICYYNAKNYFGW
jgi:glucuronate isomerase